jgi:uncharacterized protein
MNNKSVHMVAFILLVVGGLNWGLVGLFGFDLVEAILGSWPMAVKIVYVLVGLSAVYEILTHKKHCTVCQ